jgi:hypothetical protein
MFARAGKHPDAWSERGIVDAIAASHLPAENAAAVWAFLADEDNAPIRSPAIVSALIAASVTPEAREAMWAELAGSAREYRRHSVMRERSLIAFFERHRAILRPLLVRFPETEPSCDAIIQVMLASRVFGSTASESVAYVSERIPDSVARAIENELGLKRPVPWEYTAYKGMLKWKAARFLLGGTRPPRSLAELDSNGKTFVTIFNSLQVFDNGMRERTLRGLDTATLFNAAIAGEHELYRVGTYGYEAVLHGAILRDIAKAGSFEAYVDRVLPRRFSDVTASTAQNRKLAFLRIVSHFGLLPSVLATVRDRDQFADDLITALDDTRTFKSNSRVAIDLLTEPHETPQAATFKSILLDRLYARYKGASSPAHRNAYGSVLSVYQTITGDRRDAAIDREFVLDISEFNTPFERLFSRDASGVLVHRMFMRMDSDDDAFSTYAAFGTLMKTLEAAVREEVGYDIFEIGGAGRRIEIYANKPNAMGVKQGIANIAAALKNRRIETVIGRGHTAIIDRLQADAKRVLGPHIKDAALILVGSCGGDAAVHDLIATFGYKPIVTTRSTGRQVINNAVIKRYIGALLALSEGGHLAVKDMLDAATARFMRDGADRELRENADLYHVNMATVFTAQLFDAHLRHDLGPDRRVSLD